MTDSPLAVRPEGLAVHLDAIARGEVRVSDTRVGARRALNLSPGSARVTIAAVDDATHEEVDVTIDVSLADLAAALAGDGLDASGSTLVVDLSELDHGSLGGLGDDDHPQYPLRSLLTTRGDVVVRGAADWQRLGVGAANRVLRSDGTDPSWGQVQGADVASGVLGTEHAKSSINAAVRHHKWEAFA